MIRLPFELLSKSTRSHFKSPFSSLFGVCHRCMKTGFSTEDLESVDLNPSTNSGNRITKPTWPTNHNHDMRSKPHSAWDESPGVNIADKVSNKRERRDKKREKQSKTKRPNVELPKIPLEGEILYGKFPVFIALKAKRRQIYKLYLKQGIFESQAAKGSGGIHDQLMTYGRNEGIVVEPVSQEVLNALVADPVQGLRQHQGICADVSPMKYIDILPSEISSVSSITNKPSVWLVLESVQDPNNFGAILRSAYYLGVDRIIAHNSCKLSPAVSKVSAGSLELMDIYHTDDLDTLLHTCREHDWQVLGTAGMKSPSGPVVPLEKINIHRNTIIVLGNEGSGLRSDTSALCDHLITVSRHQEDCSSERLLLDSLNVSVATGIILNDLLYKRKNFSR